MSVCLLAGDAQLLVMLLSTFRYTQFMVVPCDIAIHVILHHRAKGTDIIQVLLFAAARFWVLFHLLLYTS